MADVTITTEDAERLARVGGVLNDDGHLWPMGDLPPSPFTALLYEDLHCTDNHSCVRRHGTVTVTDVHHADDCAKRNGRGEVLAITDDLLRPLLCHPDAEPNRWHWTVEATP